MLDSIRILENVSDEATFDVVHTAYIRAESYPIDFYIQLYQGDQGVPYAAESSAIVTIEFLRPDTVALEPVAQTQSVVALAPFADRSIWKVTLSEENVQKIVSGGFRVVITDSLDSTLKQMLWSNMSIRKIPADHRPLVEEE